MKKNRDCVSRSALIGWSRERKNHSLKDEEYEDDWWMQEEFILTKRKKRKLLLIEWDTLLHNEDFLLMITGFLTINEKATLALVSKQMRMLSEQDEHWLSQGHNKNDIGITRYIESKKLYIQERYIEEKIIRTTWKREEYYKWKTRNTDQLDLPKVKRACRNYPEFNVKIMKSDKFRTQIPIQEQKRPSTSSKIFAALGYGLSGLMIGIICSLYYFLRSLFVILTSIFTFGWALTKFKTSLLRDILCVTTILPLIGIMLSGFLGVYRGWRLGSQETWYWFIRNILVMQGELMLGRKEIDSEKKVDPWSCYIPTGCEKANPQVLHSLLAQPYNVDLPDELTIATRAYLTQRMKPNSLSFFKALTNRAPVKPIKSVHSIVNLGNQHSQICYLRR